jgi:hypothetical protein
MRSGPWRQAVALEVRKWRKEGPSDQARFRIVHVACPVAYINFSLYILVRRGTRDIRMRRLYARNDF